MKKKACRTCQIFYDGAACPVCKRSQSSTNWQGRVYVIDAENSEIAKKIGIKVKGEYALKVK